MEKNCASSWLFTEIALFLSAFNRNKKLLEKLLKSVIRTFMKFYLIKVALFHADDQNDKHDEANIGFSTFFCERPRKRDLSYAFSVPRNRNKVRDFMPLHLYIFPALPSFIRAYSILTNWKYGGNRRRNAQQLLHSAYISPPCFSSLSYPITSIFLQKPSAIGLVCQNRKFQRNEVIFYP